MPTPELAAAYAALDRADEAIDKLHRACCEPGRSPRMESLAATVRDVRSHMATIGGDPGRADAVITMLENAGATLGTLQVGCCAPGRMPLYATTLESLMTVQRSVNASLGRGH